MRLRILLAAALMAVACESPEEASRARVRERLKADAPLTQAADQLPTSSTVNEHLGDLRLKQERYADAVAAFERSLAGDGESIDRSKVEKKVRDARERVRK